MPNKGGLERGRLKAREDYILLKRNTFEEDPEAIPLCFVEPDPVSDADRLIPVDLVTGRLLTNCLLKIPVSLWSTHSSEAFPVQQHG